MKKTLQTFRYQIKAFSGGIFFGFLIILSTVAVTDLVYFLTDRLYNTVHPVVSLTVPFEVTTGLFALLIGLVLFITNFKVAVANGVSRKTFLLADLPAAGIAAAAFSVFNLAVVKVHGLYWPVNSISELIYPNISWAGFLILQFALYILLIIIGWFITLAYYRSSTPVKWAISLAPFVLFGLLRVANARSGGAIFEAIEEYLRMSLGTEIGKPDSYRAAASMAAYSAILGGLVYLLFRRAPLKD